MTTKEMIRCKKCSYLVIDEEDNWICQECNKPIEEIKDEECFIKEQI